MSSKNFISPLIEHQFPSFYREEGPNFIAFVKAYYEWAEQSGNFINVSRTHQQNIDIDTTLNTFIKYFKDEFISSLPENTLGDKRLLIKHILDLYRTKGTKKSYELLFRILFNEDIQFYIPGEYIFKPSDSKWYIPKYIEVSDHPLLPKLVGKTIYTKKDGSAVVDNYFIKIVNNKSINVLTLSNLVGNIKFGEQVYCKDFPEIIESNAPIVFGSLSAVSITNGGSNFEIGDELEISGSGQGGKARVASTRNENGKVTFNLLDGGHGFSVNAIVTVTGGNGTGATFSVGDIVNKQIYQIVKDQLTNFVGVQLENSSAGFNIGVANVSGTLSPGDYFTSSTNNMLKIDATKVSGDILQGEYLSNTSLSISGLYVYKNAGNLIYVLGSNTNLQNANLTNGAILAGNTSGATIQVNSVPLNGTQNATETISCSGQFVVTTGTLSTNSVINNITGLPLPGMTLTANSTGRTLKITSVTRNTDWMFPYATAASLLSNLDTNFSDLLTITTIEAGTIAYLKNVNPGIGYSSNPTVTVFEPDIFSLQIQDDTGLFYGYDASVTAKAGSANGIVSSVYVTDSGYGFNPSETVILSNINNPTSVSGVSIVDTNGIGGGFWKDSKSQASSTMALQDSYYYQNFSYEIVAPRMLETYEKFVKDLIHPSGIALFGAYSIKNELITDPVSEVSFSITQS